MRSPLPHQELHPGQQTDINTLLSLVEDIIRQQNRGAAHFYTDASKRDRSMILSLGAVSLQGKCTITFAILLILCASDAYWLVHLRTRLILKNRRSELIWWPFNTEEIYIYSISSPQDHFPSAGFIFLTQIIHFTFDIHIYKLIIIFFKVKWDIR